MDIKKSVSPITVAAVLAVIGIALACCLFWLNRGPGGGTPTAGAENAVGPLMPAGSTAPAADGNPNPGGAAVMAPGAAGIVDHTAPTVTVPPPPEIGSAAVMVPGAAGNIDRSAPPATR